MTAIRPSDHVLLVSAYMYSTLLLQFSYFPVVSFFPGSSIPLSFLFPSPSTSPHLHPNPHFLPYFLPWSPTPFLSPSFFFPFSSFHPPFPLHKSIFDKCQPPLLKQETALSSRVYVAEVDMQSFDDVVDYSLAVQHWQSTSARLVSLARDNYRSKSLHKDDWRRRNTWGPRLSLRMLH